MLLDLFRNKEKADNRIELPTELVIRESCQPLRAAQP
jgi:DNA-binding LacI/PurR family transcriptional regulator